MKDDTRTRTELLYEIQLLHQKLDIYERQFNSVVDEENIFNLINAAPGLYLLIEPDGTVIQINQETAWRIGRSPDELSGENIFEYFSPAIAKLRKLKVDEVIRTRKVVQFIDTRNDHLVFNSYSPIFDEQNKIIQISISAMDITNLQTIEKNIFHQNQLFNSSINSLSHPFLVIDPNTYRVLLKNDATMKNSGHNKLHCFELLHEREEPCAGEDSPCPLEIVKKTKAPAVLEHIHTDSNGNFHVIQVHAHPIFDDANNVVQIIESCIDITEQMLFKNTMTLLNEVLEITNSNFSKSKIFNKLAIKIQQFSKCEAVGIRMLDDEGNIPYEGYVGFEKSFYEKESPLSIKSDKCMCIYVIKGEINRQMPVFTPSGSFFINATTKFLADVSGEDKGETRNVCNAYGFESVALIPINLGGKIIGLIHLADKNEQKVPLRLILILETVAKHLGPAIQRIILDDERRRSAAEWALTFNAMKDAICLLDSSATARKCNQSMCKLLNKTEKELIGRKCYEIFHNTHNHIEFCPFTRSRKSIKRETMVLPFDDKIMEVTVDPLVDDKNKFVGAVHIVSDITIRKRMEEALAKEKEQLAITLRSIGEGVICTDGAGKIILMNRIAEKLTGWLEEEAVGKLFADVIRLIYEETRATYPNLIEQVVETQNVIIPTEDIILISRNGTERIIAKSGAPIHSSDNKIIGVVIVFSDITNKRKMEQELQKTSKLESLGVLAGGIAHDFNNILTSILGNISYAKIMDFTHEELSEILTDAENASYRAKNLTMQLLTFAKGGDPRKQNMSVAEVILNSVRFTLRGTNVAPEFQIAENLPLIEIDDVQISQVINNLVLNAVQAMPDGGKIHIKVNKIKIDSSRVIPLKVGHYILISVRDEGIGIENENLSQIFDPFFTTKKTGSGLGLTSSFSIIKKHGGYLTVESEIDKGSTFFIYLPISTKHQAIKPVITQNEDQLPGKAKILLMDDEEGLRRVAAKMISRLGYTIEGVANGEEAIRVYQQALEKKEPFDLVILDLTVPGGLGGKATMAKLLEIDPNVKAMVSSGYSNDSVMANYKDFGFINYLMKPFSANELSRSIRLALSVQNSK